MKFLLIAIILIAGAAGAEYFMLRKRADEICHTARELARHGGTVAKWVKEAGADPFLGAAALRGPPNGVIALYRDRARQITAELSARFLPPASVQAYQHLGLLRADSPELAAALEALRPATAGLDCRGPAATTTEADELAKEIATSEKFWTERKGVAVLDKQEFARDRSIFCHGEDIRKKLQSVADAAAEACKSAKPGTKLAKTCAGGGDKSVQAEIQDLDKQKELNLRKLRQKWPAAVVTGLQC